MSTLVRIALKVLRDQRRALLYWGIGLIAMAAMMALVYPSIKGISAFNEYIDNLPEAMKQMFGASLADYTSPTGYFSAELFSIMVPLLFLIYGIGAGAGAIAGEEEKGTMDFLLANPVPRWKIVVAKFGAMTAGLALLGVFFWVGIAVFVKIEGIELDLFKTAEATFNALMVALVFSSLALLLGCLKGNKGMSLGIASGVAVLTYLLNTVGAMVEGLKDYRYVSPFYHYLQPDVLRNGFDAGHLFVLIGLVVVFFVLSIPAFIRRDVGT